MEDESRKPVKETMALEGQLAASAMPVYGNLATDALGVNGDSLRRTFEPAGQQSTAKEGTGNHGLTRRLSHASVWSLFIYAAGAGLTFVTQIVIARLVGAESFGTYTYVFAWITLLSYGSTLGFHVAVLRFVPAYETTKQYPMALGFILFGSKACITVAILIAAIGTLVVIGWPHHLEPELAISVLIGLVALPLITIYLTGAGLVRAFGGVISALLPERIIRDGLMLALLGLATFFAPWRLDATVVMWMLLVSSAVAAFITVLSIWSLWPAGLSAAPPTYAFQDWWPSLLPIMIMTFVDVLMNRTAVMLLGKIGFIEGAGIFAVGSNIALLLTLPRVAVSTAFAPAISRLFAREDLTGLQALFARATILSFAGGVALALPLLVLIEPVLHAFGGEFTSGALIARILVVGQLFAAAGGPQQQLLTMTGHERAAAMLMSVAAIINVPGCIVGIALHGAVGAAIVTSATMIFLGVCQAICIRSRLGIHPGLIWAIRHVCEAVMAGRLR
ncbi:lipopolysaccharide biosynthesis protein [Mesorhizobium sp. SARCC-RB16n]|uniref:lipopolysaccharide biosynthesis protein n=1 Tax=Mesorhizobium sp. SARCC-RB16n TaxID=2116687 RepID=UPI00166A59D1|nr:polysaccharide biosynthesis C-terminal domain-containing protein [Mesorhizobium sp. SARCC-RB16n]